MDGSQSLSRRRMLVSYGTLAALGALAGCVGGDDGDDETEDPDGSDGNDSADGGDDGGGSTGGDDSGGDGDDGGSGTELDRQEANVVGVSFERQGGEYQFEVALHHDDDGEDGYANWWQVERLDGTQLGRRELLHAHSRQPFTRSETIAVPDGVDCVVVRGHDQTHEYGGRAAVVALDSGETRMVDQGSGRESFDASDCPS